MIFFDALYYFGHWIYPLQAQSLNSPRSNIAKTCRSLYTHVCVTVCVFLNGTGRLLDAFIKPEHYWQHSLFLGARERCCATLCEMISGPDMHY